MNLFAQIPDDHPAMQMRKYYCDVYTGQSIVCFESHNLDSILVVASKFIVPAQVISLYSYTQNPYNHEGIFKETLEEARYNLASHPLPCFGKKGRKPIYYYRTARQYNNDHSRTISGRYCHWRSRTSKS